MLLSYVPLFFATSTYTRWGLEQLQRSNAEKLGRSVAAHLSMLRQQTTDEAFLDLARTQIRRESVHALSLLENEGPPLAVLGDPELLRTIANETGFSTRPEVRELPTKLGPAVLVYEPSPRGGVAAVVRVDAEITRANPLAALMGLYMVVGAIALLTAAYFAMTRWIVRPILQLEQQAEKIADGARHLEPLSQAPRELLNLSWRLAEMTNRLREEEESLRAKIDEVQARTEELRLAQASVVRSERLASVGRLAAGLAHEVGNPISALMGLQDLVIDGGLTPEETADFLQRMRRETTRIHRVISDLLAYARPSGDPARAMRHGTGAPLGKGSVRDAVNAVFSLLAPQRDWQDLELEHDLPDFLPAIPMAQEEITQVLLNLIMNAADACDQKGRIEVSAAKTSPTTLEIVVEDNGPGIAPEIEGSLFEPFVSTKDVGKGTGLGLSVSKGLVESVGGSIHVENRDSGGARFTISLPTLGSTAPPQ